MIRVGIYFCMENKATLGFTCGYCSLFFPDGKYAYIWKYERYSHEVYYGDGEYLVCSKCAGWIIKQNLWSTSSVKPKE